MGEREAGSSSSLAGGGGGGESQLESIIVHKKNDDNEPIPVSEEEKKWLGSILNGNLAIQDRESGTENQHKAIWPKIEKVPEMLHDVKENSRCYLPMVVSIGPYHHGNSRLKLMQMHKLTMARQYVKEDSKLLEELYQKVRRLAKAARQCYTDLSEVAKKDEDTDQSSVDKKDEDTDQSSVAKKDEDTDQSSVAKFNDKEFSQMMFLDACFILQFIYCIVEDKQKDLKMKDNMIALVKRDLFLLENQIPFQVLDALSFKIGDETKKKRMLNKFVTKIRSLPPQSHKNSMNFCFRNLASWGRKEVQGAEEIAGTFDGEPAHLLDLMRSNLFEKSVLSQKPPENCSDWFSYRSAKELKAVGIHVRPSKTNKFTDVDFKSGYLAVLKLPPIYIDDLTRSLLLNMVAYESSPNGPDDFGVSSYICLMDSLIDHAEDVMELRKRGTLLNFLGSDQQVADLFNEVADNLVSHPYAYAIVKDGIEKHYKNRLKIWVAEWLHTHFTSPWTLLAFIGAILALFLTVIQTYESVKPSNC